MADDTFPKKSQTRTAGIVPVPLGSRGPRSLYLRRHGDSFGFRIRHFILYPPDSVAGDTRHAFVGSLQEPMETIFVKELNEKAKEAGLQLGDKLIAVNSVPVAEISYKQVVSLIYHSQEYLHLLVVPKEEDTLQKFFSEAAYNPASNQTIPDPTQSSRVFKYAQTQNDFQKDAVSFRSFDSTYSDNTILGHGKGHLEQRSADNLLQEQVQEDIYSTPYQKTFSEGYLDPTIPNDVYYRSRAQPQVPLNKKMGRRASEGNMLSEKDIYESVTSHSSKMGAPVKSIDNYQIAMDESRRDSTASLTSSVAESSKGSISSFNSISTLTGHETDDTSIIDRIRRNVQQKEEFLRRSSNPYEKTITPKEFYSRPNRLEKPIWPPTEPIKSTQQKPTHQNFQKIKNDIEMERSHFILQQQQFENKQKVDNSVLSMQKENIGSQKDTHDGGSMSSLESIDKRIPQSQMVSKRTKLFETGKPVPEDFEDTVQIDRTNFHKSELARLSAVHAIPNVNCRAREFENLVENKKEESVNSVGSMPEKNKDALIESKPEKMSGNVLTFVGGKNLHCPPPTSGCNGETINDKPTVIRRTKNLNIDEEERATRRESYLKATEGGRVMFDNDFSNCDISSNTIKSPNINGTNGSNGSLEKILSQDRKDETQRKLMEIDEKNSLSSSQRAEPQTTPASTSIQVQGAQLSPQFSTKSKIQSTFRNRSPTGQSPVSKSRKSAQVPEPVFNTPKIKTWRGRVANKFKKIHPGVSGPSSPTAPEVSTFGVPLNYCLPSEDNRFVPRIVKVCTEIVESKGLDTIGIYRVPGNNAGVTALTEEVNKCYDEIPQIDPKWNDVHVVSSLLKSFFRKMPDSLLTTAAYPSFIQADKIQDSKLRMEKLKNIIKNLPPHHYCTLQHLMLHLKKVVEHSEFNKMDPRNLAIVFGPTLVRAGEENMEMMVNDMTHQCKIVETLLNYVDWFFSEDDTNAWKLAVLEKQAEFSINESEQSKQALLRENICKMEALKDQKEKKEFIQNLLSAAQRKVNRKKAKHGRSFEQPKEEPSSPFKELSNDEYSLPDSPISKSADVPTTVTEIEKMRTNSERVPWFNYNTDKEEVQKRIANFIKETESNLQRSRNIEIKVPTTGNTATKTLSHALPLKTQSASNIFARNTLQDIDKYSLSGESDCSNKCKTIGDRNWINTDCKYSDVNSKCDIENFQACSMRKGSSEKILNSPEKDGGISSKKDKYRLEGDVSKMSGSLESLSKLQDNIEGTDLLAEMTQLFNEKSKSLHASKDLYFEQSENIDPSENGNKELPTSPKSFRNPSLHKSQVLNERKSVDCKLTEINECEKDKDEGSEMESIPDNEKHIINEEKISFTVGKKEVLSHPKLKRSESLNRSEKSYTSSKRSDLNKNSDIRVRRHDSLSKTEKTENNISKRRELSSSFNKRKEFTKLKRKNGMPERSIKRRHTVGGTKDPDKISLLDNRYHKKSSTLVNNKNEKPMRISSPDLRSTRKEKFLFEVTVFGSDDMIVQFRQRVLSSRPQSYSEAYKVALESHV